MRHDGVGVHCFAGGFTLGVRTVLPTVGQLEIHGFGGDTARKAGITFMNADDWQGWDAYKKTWQDCRFCYGNPRCTAFSSYSAGASIKARGPTADCTQDIWDLCRFGLHADLDVIAFESVQQCYTVGRPLLDRLRDELFVPNHYRIAHLFVCTAAEGNAQRRKRYFFVAYRDDKNFNVSKPALPGRCTTVRDVLEEPRFAEARVREYKLNGTDNIDYDANCYTELTDDEKSVLSYMQEGWSLNHLARTYNESLGEINAHFGQLWRRRTSDLPFSLHGIARIRNDWFCPTIASTSDRLIHPIKDRPLTLGEIAAMMGWPEGHIPVGPNPVAQIGKGVVPATAAWLAAQIRDYLDDAWSEDDFESTYRSGEWFGTDYTRTLSHPVEKVFNMTAYLPPMEGKRC